MVDVEVGGVVFVDVDFEVADVVLGFGGEEEVVGGEDLELFALFIVVLLWEEEGQYGGSPKRGEGEGEGGIYIWPGGVWYLVHGDVRVCFAGLVEGEAFDVSEHAHCCES